MLVLLRPQGQTSNQFIQHVNLDAFCKGHNIIFYDPAFLQYLNDYPSLRLLKLNIVVSKFIWLILRVKNIINKKHIIDFDIPENIEYYSQNPKKLKWSIRFCHGWSFRTSLVSDYRNDYQLQFSPIIDQKALINRFLTKSSSAQNIIGIHIRRGDYIAHRGGVYYFDDEVYIQYIYEVLNILGQDSKIILFTNDQDFNFGEYQKLFQDILLSNCSVVEDHYIMSQCDYLLGPPSTFTVWASYMGLAKLYHFKTKNDVLNIDIFEDTIHH